MLAPNPRYQFPHIAFATFYALLMGAITYSVVTLVAPVLLALLSSCLVSGFCLFALVGAFGPNPSRLKVTLHTYRADNYAVWASLFVATSLCFSVIAASLVHQFGMWLPPLVGVPFGFIPGYLLMQLFQRHFKPTLAHR